MKQVQASDRMMRRQLVALLPRLRRFAMTLTGDSERANDLVQVACERALTRFDHLRQGARIDSWLFRIMYTQWIDKMRRKKSRKAKLAVLSHASGSAFTAGGPGKSIDATLDVQNALASIPEENRTALMLVSVEGYTYAEAAAVLQVPSGTVASRVARARSMMNRLLLEKPGPILHDFKTKRAEAKR